MGSLKLPSWVRWIFSIVILLLLFPASFSQVTKGGEGYAEHELLVRFRERTTAAARSRAHAANGARVLRQYRHLPGLEHVRLGDEARVADAIAEYRKDPNVLYAEPNYRLEAQVAPNDPDYSQQWGMKTIGAEQAWQTTTGSPSVVVGVIDTGVDYTHPDLAANIWTNSLDCNSNGVDDDGDGYVDDCHGIDLVNGDSDPMDDHFHGTHVAGIIGAAGNNGKGVAGVAWNVKIAACKFLGENGIGYLSDAVQCLDYFATLKDRGVNVVATNNSWGSTDFSPVLYASNTLHDALKLQMEKGILFVVAATNGGFDHRGDDNDLATPDQMPSATGLPNMIAVAAVGDDGKLASFSNYGRHSVHLAAPGVDVLSTVPGFNDPGLYHAYSGTSMATPHVTGSVALLKAWRPELSWHEIRNLLLAGAVPMPQAGKTLSQGTLNLPGAMNCADKVLFERTQPMSSVLIASAGATVPLEMLHVRCAVPEGAMTVIANGTPLELHDDGVAPDAFAGDGVYTASWTAPGPGSYALEFPNGDNVSVHVLLPYSFQKVSETPRQFTGASLEFTQAPFEVREITPPFPLQFGGSTFSSVYVSGTGTLSFGTPFSQLWSQPMPVQEGNAIVAPFWDILLTNSYPPDWLQNVYWEVLGAAPNRELAIEWRDVTRATTLERKTETIRFQAILFESKPDILFIYPDATFGGDTSLADGAGEATIGIQTSPLDAVQYSYRRVSLRDGDALLWTTIASDDVAAPELQAVTPASVIQGLSDRSITLTGTHFRPGALVRLFGIEDPPPSLQPSSVTDSEIAVTVPGKYLQWEGGIQFSVYVPGYGESNVLALGIDPSPTAPRITALSPTSAIGGSSTPLTLTILGKRFTTASRVWFGDDVRTPTFVSDGELRLGVTTADLKEAGPRGVTILDAERSNTFQFLVVDFSVNIAGWDQPRVRQGESAALGLFLDSSWGTFRNPVTFSCVGLPAGAKCIFAKPSVVPTSGQFVDVTITTSATASMSSVHRSDGRHGMEALELAAMMLLPALVLAGPVRPGRKRLALVLLLAGLCMAALSCGGGQAPTSGPPRPPTGSPPPTSGVTPPGQYVVTVNGSSGSLTHGFNILLTVDPRQ